jgi:hypothetical protein
MESGNVRASDRYALRAKAHAEATQLLGGQRAVQSVIEGGIAKVRGNLHGMREK